MDVAALLRWYRAHARRLPWREEVSPYRTLVSELMLQQTRVETVIPYFHRFLDAFPTPEALAAAPEESVLALWSGLGYYSRARNLQRAAQAVVAAGAFPSTVAGLEALPGIGPYTAGAIASIALGQDAPLVDGNVERVLARWYGWPTPTRTQLWDTVRSLLPVGEAGDFNQALMELGATCCTPRSPTCLLCPVAKGCTGTGAPERYPAPKPKKEVPRQEAVAAVIRREGAVLLARRPDGGLLGGLWELPGGEGTDLAIVLRARLGCAVADPQALGVVEHRFTHLHLTTRVYTAGMDGTPQIAWYQAARFVPAAEVSGMALSTLARKTLRLAALGG